MVHRKEDILRRLLYRLFAIFVIALLSVTTLTGCGEGEKQEIVLTSEFKADEILRIDTESCSRPELLIYLYYFIYYRVWPILCTKT